MTKDLPVFGFFFVAFFQIEAIDPPIKNIYVTDMLSFVGYPILNMRKILTRGPPPTPAV